MRFNMALIFAALTAATQLFAATETIDGITWTYSVADVGVTITGAKTSTGADVSGAIVIPETLGGHEVTQVGYSIFSGCKGISSVTFPASVTSIGDRVFYGCTGLRKITFGSGLKSIGASAFSGCASVREASMPFGLETLGGNAFANCSSLNSIVIPDSVASVGSGAFAGCKAAATLKLSTSLSAISDSAFAECYGIESVVIPDNVASIDRQAFAGCSSLATVTIGKGVVSIGSRAFGKCNSASGWDPDFDVGCTNLQSVFFHCYYEPYMGDYVFGYDDGWNSSLPKNCTAYVVPSAGGWDASIPGEWNGIQIKWMTTSFCTVTLNANGGSGGGTMTVASGAAIGELPTPTRSGYVFNGWFTAPSGGSQVTASTVVGANATYYAHWTKSESEGGGVGGVLTAKVNGVTWSYTVSDGRATLGGGSADSPAVPSSTSGALFIPSYVGGYKVTSIADEAFYGCDKLTSVTIPDGVNSIGSCAFCDCSRLANVLIPESVGSIGVGAFWNTPYDAAVQVKMSELVSGAADGASPASGAYSLSGLSGVGEDRTIATVNVYGDCPIGDFVLKDGKVYDSVLRIVNKTGSEAYVILPDGYVYETIGNSSPLVVPASSTSLLTITRTDDKTFLVTRQTLNVIQ